MHFAAAYDNGFVRMREYIKHLLTVTAPYSFCELCALTCVLLILLFKCISEGKETATEKKINKCVFGLTHADYSVTAEMKSWNIQMQIKPEEEENEKNMVKSEPATSTREMKRERHEWRGKIQKSHFEHLLRRIETCFSCIRAFKRLLFYIHIFLFLVSCSFLTSSFWHGITTTEL